MLFTTLQYETDVTHGHTLAIQVAIAQKRYTKKFHN